MRILRWTDLGSHRVLPGPVAATIGVFDGVHRGHQALLEELVRDPVSGGTSLVVTFRENPKKALKSRFPGDLMTWPEKERALSDAGVGVAVIIDFSPSFSTMSGRDFFLHLKKSFVFSKLVLGWNFSFGKDSATTAADLGWLADAETRLMILPPFRVDGQVVSSSAVRQAIAEGNMTRARNLLGRPYVFPLEPPFRWEGGRATAFRSAAGKILPPPGQYPVRLDGRQTVLTVSDESLTWESPPGIDVHEVVFE